MYRVGNRAKLMHSCCVQTLVLMIVGWRRGRLIVHFPQPVEYFLSASDLSQCLYAFKDAWSSLSRLHLDKCLVFRQQCLPL